MQRTTSNIPLKNKLGDIVAYSEVAIRNNIAAVEYCRTSIAAISGSAAGKISPQTNSYLFEKKILNIILFVPLGILGLNGLIGFLFYVASVLVLWLLIMIKSGTQWRRYFINRRSLLTNSFMGALCTYVLFWTFLYGMVHVY